MRYLSFSSKTGRKLVLSGCTAVTLAILSICPATLHAQNAENHDHSTQLKVLLPLTAGYFNGAEVLYITPEVGVNPNAGASVIATAKQIAAGFKANFIPTNFATLPDSPAVDDIFVFTNFKQGNVLASAPHPTGPANTDTNYSPLWQISEVTWKPGYRPHALTSQAQITDAADNGKVTITKTPIIVECSVMYTPSGGKLPGARIIGDGDDH